MQQSTRTNLVNVGEATVFPLPEVDVAAKLNATNKEYLDNLAVAFERSVSGLTDDELIAASEQTKKHFTASLDGEVDTAITSLRITETPNVGKRELMNWYGMEQEQKPEPIALQNLRIELAGELKACNIPLDAISEELIISTYTHGIGAVVADVRSKQAKIHELFDDFAMNPEFLRSALQEKYADELAGVYERIMKFRDRDALKTSGRIGRTVFGRQDDRQLSDDSIESLLKRVAILEPSMALNNYISSAYLHYLREVFGISTQSRNGAENDSFRLKYHLPFVSRKTPKESVDEGVNVFYKWAVMGDSPLSKIIDELAGDNPERNKRKTRNKTRDEEYGQEPTWQKRVWSNFNDFDKEKPNVEKAFDLEPWQAQVFSKFEDLVSRMKLSNEDATFIKRDLMRLRKELKEIGMTDSIGGDLIQNTKAMLRALLKVNHPDLKKSQAVSPEELKTNKRYVSLLTRMFEDMKVVRFR